MAEVTVEVEVFCYRCDAALTPREAAFGAIQVEPCDKCLDRARDEAVNEYINRENS